MSSFALKIIAVLSMLLDHLFKADLFGQKQLMEWFGLSIQASYSVCRIVEPLGRLAFPIYAFFIAEGCRRTRSRKNYILRLLIFGVISEIPYDVALTPFGGRPWYAVITPLTDMNVFFTLALGALGIALYERLRARGKNGVLPWMPPAACAVAAALFRTDYILFGPLLIDAAYFPGSKKARLAAMAGMLALIYLGYCASWFMCFTVSETLSFAAACLALALLALYDGRRGPKVRWMFYAVYPAHLALYAILKIMN